jgi:hypothetical protein
MDLKVLNIPAELFEYRDVIKEIALSFGISDIRYLSFAPDDLPFTTAVLHLYNDVDFEFYRDSVEEAITERDQINTFINNKSAIFEDIRELVEKASVPL